jgi:hypothetical protein
VSDAGQLRIRELLREGAAMLGPPVSELAA